MLMKYADFINQKDVANTSRRNKQTDLSVFLNLDKISDVQLQKMKTNQLEERQPKIRTRREVRTLGKQVGAMRVTLGDTRCILNLLLRLSEKKSSVQLGLACQMPQQDVNTSDFFNASSESMFRVLYLTLSNCRLDSC